MWNKKSKLELLSLTMNSDNTNKTINVLIKRLEADNCFENTLKNRWIKRLKEILKKEDEYKKEDSVNRVLKSIYDYGDTRRIWVS